MKYFKNVLKNVKLSKLESDIVKIEVENSECYLVSLHQYDVILKQRIFPSITFSNDIEIDINIKDLEKLKKVKGDNIAPEISENEIKFIISNFENKKKTITIKKSDKSFLDRIYNQYKNKSEYYSAYNEFSMFISMFNEQLIAGYKATEKFTSKDPTSQYLNTISLKSNISNNTMQFLATDSKRMVRKIIPEINYQNVKENFIFCCDIVPLKIATKITHSFDKITFKSYLNNVYTIEGNGFIIFHKLVNNQLPEFDDFKPKINDIKYELSFIAENWIDIFKESENFIYSDPDSEFQGQRYNNCSRMHINGNFVEIKVDNEKYNYQNILPCKIEQTSNKTFKVGIKPQYIYEAFENKKSPAKIFFQGSEKPILISQGSSYECVIMPMRLV